MSDVLAALVSGCFLVLVTVIGIYLPRLLAQGRDLKEVKHQVKNSHDTNLRDDIDSLRYELRGGFHEIHTRLHRLESKVDG